MIESPEYKYGDRVSVVSEQFGCKAEIVTIDSLVYRDGVTPLYKAGKRILKDTEIYGLATITPEHNERAKVLSEAEQLINGDRAQAYGDPETNFGRLAQLWAPILGAEITPTQVALCLTQLKISRLINTPDHRDSYIDAAGYIALGAELAKEKK